MQQLSPGDAALAKQHLVTRLTKSPDILLLKASKGIAPHLTKDEISPIVDALVRVVVFGKPRDAVKDARTFIVSLWSELPGGESGLDGVVISRLDNWIIHFNEKSQEY